MRNIVNSCKVQEKLPTMKTLFGLLIVFSATNVGEWLQIVLGLNHGRDAKLGEFPFVMRIQISEEGSAQVTQGQDSGNVATGVLVQPKKVLTTCDSVGFFTSQTVNLYDLNRVTIMGGSIKKSGVGGVTQAPINSSVHPYCYSLMVSRIILFNYGMYEVDNEFISPHISPIKHPFKNQREMTAVMKDLWEVRVHHLKCETAGWGNPRKQFEGTGMPDRFERFAPVLQTTELEITTYDYCRKETCDFFGECLLSLWEYGFMCGKAKKGGPCDEDEGAPLICGGAVIGIYSNPERCEDVGLARPFLRLDLAYEFVYGTGGASTTRITSILTSSALWLTVKPYF